MKTDLKEKVISLRLSGKTYREIREITGENTSKSTISLWCRGIQLSKDNRERIDRIITEKTKKAREKAILSNKQKRGKYLQSIKENNRHLAEVLKNKDTAKIALAMLYLGEGSKTRASIMLGNSDPLIMQLFLKLLRMCYIINEKKFRCTLQCRADQNIPKLEEYWSEITGIPLEQFYKAQIDPRTIGKPSKKPDYKGVCRLDYFSADILNELTEIAKILHSGI